MTTGAEESDWAARVAGAIADEVKRLRRLRGMSAQQLADQCEELGLPIARSVIANLESKRRLTVSVPEVIVLSRALQVPPVSLIFPIGNTEKIEILPGLNVDPLDAIEYLTGSALPPGVAKENYEEHQLFLYRRHKAKSEYVAVLMGRLKVAREDFSRFSFRLNDSWEQEAYARLESLELRRAGIMVGLNEAELKGWDELGKAVRSLQDEFRSVSHEISRLEADLKDYTQDKSQYEYAKWTVESNLENLREQCSILISIRKKLGEIGAKMPVLSDLAKEAIAEAGNTVSEETFSARDGVIEPVKVVEPGD